MCGRNEVTNEPRTASLIADSAYSPSIQAWPRKWTQPSSTRSCSAFLGKTLEPGPVGDYVAVIDQDEAGRQCFSPVNLDDPSVLADDGLPPSDGNPQFHQQMVYAVAMQTIGTFEKALGRQVHWPQRGSEYSKQIVIHPHYMNEMNAYYPSTSEKGAVMFGYVEAPKDSLLPGMIVFTCLSQDVIAHQLGHAILGALPFQYSDEKNPDVSAFHEGFCDLVALLQRFSLPELLRHQLALNPR